MLERDVRKPLIFIHIPKTAGSTLQQVVYNNYLDTEILVLGRPSSDDKQQNRSFGEIHNRHVQFIKSGGIGNSNKLKVLFGHMEFGFHAYFANGAQYATMLRDPVSRVVSHYNFVRRSPAHYLYDKVVRESLSLDDYVERTRAKELNNGQVRVLYGDGHKRIPFNEIRQEHLGAALDNIKKHFIFVGIQERFNESIDSLARIMRWSVPLVESRNVSEASDYAITADAKEKILSYNQLDMLLYEQVFSGLDQILR